MRSVFLLSVLAYVLILGVSYPFVAGMVYLWIDIVKPQNLAYVVINTLPLSMIAAVGVLISYALNGEKKSFNFTGVMALVLLLAGWITVTSYIANPLLDSWQKWDWAFKGLIFTAFIPLIFRTRVHLEAFLLTIVFSVATSTVSAAIKTLFGGGGYGVLAVLGNGNTGLSETSTLAAVSLMLLPIMHYLYYNSVIFPQSRIFKNVILCIGVCNVLTVVGTSARTGIIVGAFLVFCYILRSKRKFLWSILLALALGTGTLLNVSDTGWGQRMSTINSYEKDSSAAGRIKVWEWTVNFVGQNPMGGGFNAFNLNGIASVDQDGNVDYFPPGVVRGKAFHSIYFEVLGEQGVLGFIIYISIMLLTIFRLTRIRKMFRNDPELLWASDLALHMRDAQCALLVGGLFIGIAFQPVMFYFVAATVCLSTMTLKKKSTSMLMKKNAKTS